MRILVVEDEKIIAGKIRMGLMEEGWAVDIAYTGKVARENLAAIRFDLIILDIKLPDENGISICQWIREKKIDSYVLMLTGLTDVENKKSALDGGADYYLTKPFDFEELYATIRALIRRERGVTSPRIEVGELVMDTSTREVWQSGKPVFLKGKEFPVLECLMRHPGGLITKMTIEQRVHDLELNTGYNLAEVYISRLRNKLDKPGQESLIETVRGAGYRLRVR
jgi:DNA-binding response OmpR family regulator